MKKKNNIRQQDPFLEREREQYEQPLPSREFILQTLTEQGAPVGDEELLQLLHIEKDEEDLFSRRLRAMERDGQIMRNRKRDILGRALGGDRRERRGGEQRRAQCCAGRPHMQRRGPRRAPAPGDDAAERDGDEQEPEGCERAAQEHRIREPGHDRIPGEKRKRDSCDSPVRSAEPEHGARDDEARRRRSTHRRKAEERAGHRGLSRDCLGNHSPPAICAEDRTAAARS